MAQSPAEGRGPRQVPVHEDLDVLVEVAAGVRELLELVEQHGLADPPQTGQELALAVGPPEKALEGHVHGVDGGLAADERRGRVPAPGLYGFRTGPRREFTQLSGRYTWSGSYHNAPARLRLYRRSRISVHNSYFPPLRAQSGGYRPDTESPPATLCQHGAASPTTGGDCRGGELSFWGTGGEIHRGGRLRRRPCGCPDQLLVHQFRCQDDVGVLAPTGPKGSLQRPHRRHRQFGERGQYLDPNRGLFKGAAVGVEAYAAYVNSQGGIDGRKIIVNASDDQFTGATNKQLTEEAVQSDFATVGSFSTEDSFGGVVLAANPQMPNVSIALDPATQRLPNTFAAVPPAAFWPLGPLVYFKDKFPTKVLHTATIVADLPSTLNLWNYEKAAMDHVGYKVLYSPALPATTTDFTAQIVTMKDMGVQILFLEQEPQNYAASIFKDLDEQNFHPVVVLGTAAYSHQLIANSGGPSNVDGAYLEQQEALFLGEDAPAIPAVATFNLGTEGVSGFHHRLLHPPGMARRGALRTRPPQRGVEPEQRFVAGGTPQGHLVQRQRTGADQQSCAENPEWLLHHRTGGPRNLPTARRPADRRANPWVPL